jgi:hypothetical protein
LRNRLLSGDLINRIPQYADAFDVDPGIVDLNYNVLHAGGWLLNMAVDRFIIDYSWKKFQFRLGRQRINWGIALVWNPNDIFNAFSYMDFDYEERPGSDAFWATWYPTAYSSLDAVFKIDHDKRTTIAARYLFNVKQYDLQFIAGKVEHDIAAGFGWAGNIKNAGFRGEMTLFVPVIHEDGIKESISLSGTLETDYYFSSSLYLHGAFLFNSLGSLDRSGGLSLFNASSDMNAKMLSMGMFELFAQVAYPATPILNLGFATLFNPADLSAYLSPNITISLLNDLDLMLSAQFLLGKTGGEYSAMGNICTAFVRLKWSFETHSKKKIR